MIRHGNFRMTFSIANSTATPADLRFTLYDANGNEQGCQEQILPVGSQREWTLADLFNLQQFRGTMRF